MIDAHIMKEHIESLEPDESDRLKVYHDGRCIIEIFRESFMGDDKIIIATMAGPWMSMLTTIYDPELSIESFTNILTIKDRNHQCKTVIYCNDFDSMHVGGEDEEE